MLYFWFSGTVHNAEIINRKDTFKDLKNSEKKSNTTCDCFVRLCLLVIDWFSGKIHN